MKYASKVAEELIRLANVSPFIFRTVAKDDVVVNGKCYDLPSITCWYSLHESMFYIDLCYFDLIPLDSDKKCAFVSF